MFAERSPSESSNVIQVRDTLHAIPYDIKIPLKLEKKRASETQEDDDWRSIGLSVNNKGFEIS